MTGMLCHTCVHCHWQTRRALYGWWDETCTHPARGSDWPLVGEATECPGYERWPPMSKFETGLGFVFDKEGGLSDDTRDHGGLTKYGITQSTYDSWRRAKNLPLASVTSLSRAEATSIYHEWYWDAAGCELLPPVLATCAFDAMVNHRPFVAISLMQRTLGIPADGVIGPVTQKAYREAVDSPQLVWKFVADRLDFYANLVVQDPSQLAFLKGWQRRAHALERLLWPAP